MTTETREADTPFFPFALTDLKYWIIRRKDGMIVKYQVVGPEGAVGSPISTHGAPPTAALLLNKWCHHNPTAEPIFVGKKVDLYIADSAGCRAYRDDFHFVLDCGDILTTAVVTRTTPNLFAGDPILCRAMGKYGVGKENVVDTRFLQIAWDDRAAPPVTFEFWPAFLAQLEKAAQAEGATLLTACQGGHGRSGTALVCLMMVMNPEYTPADAITHLRAMHCPRAIESIMQHEYIGKFGEFLGRENDIARVKGVLDFRAEFMKMTHPSAKCYQEQLPLEQDQ